MTPTEIAEFNILRRRGVIVPCTRCNGLGWRAYSSGSTWRGGMGTTSIAYDVCDVCWGSGDQHRHGVDLRKLEAEEADRVAFRASTLLADRCGVHLSVLWPALEELAKELDAAGRQRRPRPSGWDAVTRSLARMLREMVAAAARGEKR